MQRDYKDITLWKDISEDQWNDWKSTEPYL